MDRWAWEQLEPWLQRGRLPIGALFCVIRGPTAGRHWEASAASARNCITLPPRPACAGGSRRTSCSMRTRSRWRAKACRL